MVIDISRCEAGGQWLTFLGIVISTLPPSGYGKDSHVKRKGRLFSEKTALSPDMENHKAHSSNLGRRVFNFQAGREMEIVEVQFFILVFFKRTGSRVRPFKLKVF